MSTENGHQHGSLNDLFEYPLMSALVDRRTRRLARGTSMKAGPLSHESKNDPAPLSALEEAILITCVTGITGVTTHDGPLTKADGTDELGTPFLHIMARTGSSADNCQATHFFMINDDGIFLLRHPTGKEALALLTSLPPRWADWSESDWIRAADSCKIRVSDRRMEFPREWPYYLGWNAQMSNVPGSTVLFPVVDCTSQYINALLIIASEPDGKRPIFVDDWRTFHPKGLVERMAKLAGTLGMAEKVPYHPIGGLKWVRNGFVNKDNVAPLGFGGALRTDYEAFFYFQNLMLVGQAMGLGGWIHGSVFPPYVFQDDPAKGLHGLGFRFQQPNTLSPWAPVPASQPNPIGIDGILEGLTPPYVKSMDEAVDRVIEAKYSAAGGAYGDEDVFSRQYKDRASAGKYMKKATKFAPRQVEYVKEMCNYIYDTYGRFPAHVDAFYTPGMWLQFSHLEMEYYDRYYDKAQYERQAAHDKLWHGR
ncbi:MAG: hypothetical protein HN396_03055 [Gemmatimonadales bacterium]|jgi:hypothetical protein|nr:hypothetical protein [Gemmatimonadales bacterium]MDG2239715.1 hypothetical protein [Longimicrobiales bacterium]MBT3500167.1 hypothetical protein [Gemmatimonadales bacterium]MBT3773269.1 hypothetical protein [Gemmatimonadales bacterium]MBT3958951.1 hypothetical protein [Gemmatimonadales bacterium]